MYTIYILLYESFFSHKSFLEKLSEGVAESTNSLSFRRDLHDSGAVRGGIDYMPDRNYTVIRAKLMPDCDYIPGERAFPLFHIHF
jgi:hypothetical protein